jgi:hypothetical protein
MKSILPALASCFLVSCTAYQVMTVSSREVKQNQANEFVVENDSLELSYNFNGKDGPVKIMIRNKLQQPIYVDWKRSALIINDRAVSFAPGKVPIEGSIATANYAWSKEWSSSYSRLSATAQLPTETAFIPPGTYVSQQLIGITNQALEQLPDSIFSKKNIPAIGDSYAAIKQAFFTAESSPLVFKSYITMLIGDTLPKPVIYQHNFYVSELIKMTDTPELLNGDKRGDRFYVVGGPVNDSISIGYGVVNGNAVLQRKAQSLR